MYKPLLFLVISRSSKIRSQNIAKRGSSKIYILSVFNMVQSIFHLLHLVTNMFTDKMKLMFDVTMFEFQW